MEDAAEIQRCSSAQERGGGIESMPVRTDHEFQWLWTLATCAIRPPLSRQGKGYLMKPARTQNTTGGPPLPIATRTFPLHPDIIFRRRKPKRKHLKKKWQPQRGFKLKIRHNIYENEADTK